MKHIWWIIKLDLIWEWSDETWCTTNKNTMNHTDWSEIIKWVANPLVLRVSSGVGATPLLFVVFRSLIRRIRLRHPVDMIDGAFIIIRSHANPTQQKSGPSGLNKWMTCSGNVHLTEMIYFFVMWNWGCSSIRLFLKNKMESPWAP